jgi:lipopolysaccharide export system permease protein
MGRLDRYVLRQWVMTFVLSVFGIPAVATLIRLSEVFGPLTNRGVPTRDIMIGTALLYPGQMAMLFPAGVLFATVFTLNAMGRHSELTAVKAGGISFYRLIAPMLVLATIMIPINFGLQEVAAVSTARQRELHLEVPSPDHQMRSNFAYQGESGWTWAVRELQRGKGYMKTLLIESPIDTAGQRWMIAGDSAQWDAETTRWTMHRGASHFVGDSGVLETFSFATMRSPVVNIPPSGLTTLFTKAEEMRTAELATYLDRMRRSGAQPGMLAVDLKLKYAIPVACLVVALFGAPLAVTAPRAGAALGLAIALGTTLVYLTGTQIMKAIGGKELVSTDLAAWSMNGIFLALAVVLMVRVRT